MTDEPSSTDPTRIATVAVTTDDAVTALEASRRNGRPVVLRVTPPFAGRMRARLHVAGTESEYDGDADPLHIPPERLVSDDAPAYPEVDATEDELRSADEEFSVAKHRDEHVSAVESWRAEIRDSLVDRVAVPVAGGTHDVEVRWLG